MAIKKTYGVNFPFRESTDGTYLDLTENVPEEVRADLLHLILTRKGSRYYLPDFGTRLSNAVPKGFRPCYGHGGRKRLACSSDCLGRREAGLLFH